ncbi:hypothetical protein [Streptosporangium roseum]|uniref:hypothetical protein n=1 Tax=Streptosporangium roseum TaxID=2001 RepID=UPI0033323ED4
MSFTAPPACAGLGAWTDRMPQHNASLGRDRAIHEVRRSRRNRSAQFGPVQLNGPLMTLSHHFTDFAPDPEK